MEHINGYKVTGNCEVDAATKESLVQHLEEHGIMSLLTSHKFAPFVSCVAKELGRAMAETATPIATTTAIDLTGNQEATASMADDATESPADRCIYFRSPTSSLWDPLKLTGTASWRMGSSKGYNSRLEPFN